MSGSSISSRVFAPETMAARRVSRRRMRVAAVAGILAAPAVVLMADIHGRVGVDGWSVVHLVLFALLFVLVGFGATQAVIGGWLRGRGGDPFRIVGSLGADDGAPLTVPVAVVMPICNEEVGRVVEGMRVIFESVAATGRLPNCDFFLLSDSTDPNTWVAEEAAWLALTQQLGASGRIYYRKRRLGTNKKAGNIADFCRRWGRHYRYMVVLDADSIVAGEAVVQLVRLMERNRGVGMVQAVPCLANGETILARLQQFASRLYGPVYAAGLNYWQLSEANYWGHNAIIRVAPFIRHCSLPELPGDGPFGGRVLSHDYVEAAMMRRAGWQVWLAPEIEANFEECPANLIDFAKRDRRWLQGNLQHLRFIFARGIHPVSRLHFTLGILSYLASPLWLAFLIVSLVIGWRLAGTGLELLPAPSLVPGARWSLGAEALVLFVFTMVILFLPKVIALLDLRGRRAEVAGFGGWRRLGWGVVLETFVFTLLAPILMAFHTKFIVLTLCRRSITWGKQRRGREGEATWREATMAHAGHTLAGLGGAALALSVSPVMAAWMAPILAGLILSIPLSRWTGSVANGLWLRRRGIFLTPEEAQPAAELRRLADGLAARPGGEPEDAVLRDDYGLLQAVVDPFVNAAHVALLRSKADPPRAKEEHFAGLRARLLHDGPGALPVKEKISLLMDADSMHALHEEVWAWPDSNLNAWWQRALRHYAVISPKPLTAFVLAG